MNWKIRRGGRGTGGALSDPERRGNPGNLRAGGARFPAICPYVDGGAKEESLPFFIQPLAAVHEGMRAVGAWFFAASLRHVRETEYWVKVAAP